MPNITFSQIYISPITLLFFTQPYFYSYHFVHERLFLLIIQNNLIGQNVKKEFLSAFRLKDIFEKEKFLPTVI